MSIRIVTDGPIPSEYSMLSFAAVAFTDKRAMVGPFERNLKALPGAKQCEETMLWWKKNPVAFKKSHGITMQSREIDGRIRGMAAGST